MNILADLFDNQAVDTLEEWAMDDHRPLAECINNALLEKAGIDDEYGFRIFDENDPEEGLTLAQRVSGTELAMHIDFNDRPTEREAFKHCIPGEIRRNWDDASRAKRSAYVKALDAQHKAWLQQIKIDLTQINTLVELYAIVDQCVAHDEHLESLTGREFCDSYAALAWDFINAEVRIRKGVTPKAVVVEHIKTERVVTQVIVVQHFMMKNKEGGKAIAFSKQERLRYEQEGWLCVAQSKG
jgi:hypothetical protein